VASNRHTPRLVRLAVVTTITAFTVSLLPGVSEAAPVKPASTPKTSQDAATKVEQLANQLETLSEEINGRAIQVKKLTTIAIKAKQAAATADQRYKQLAGEVSAIVRQTYMAAPFGQFTTLMTSGSPQDFLDQLSTLERMSETRGKVIGGAFKAKQQRDAATAAATSALRQASGQLKSLQAKKASLSKQIAQYRAMFDALSAKERAQLVGNGGGTADRGERQTIPTGLPPAPNPRAKVAVQTALDQLGKPYSWGAAGPSQFDCSGLTMYAWAAAGVQLPHQSGEQYGYGTHVAADLAVLKPGDLLFFYEPIHHVALYIGSGKMVHAPTEGVPVQVVNVDWKNIVGATRL
jgi:cell wall-associated NlpC family hydrolase